MAGSTAYTVAAVMNRAISMPSHNNGLLRHNIIILPILSSIKITANAQSHIVASAGQPFPKCRPQGCYGAGAKIAAFHHMGLTTLLTEGVLLHTIWYAAALSSRRHVPIH